MTLCSSFYTSTQLGIKFRSSCTILCRDTMTLAIAFTPELVFIGTDFGYVGVTDAGTCRTVVVLSIITILKSSCTWCKYK